MAKKESDESREITLSERGIEIHNFGQAIDFGRAVIQAGFAPRGMDTPVKIALAVAFGADVGLKPLQAIQNVSVVNGKPSLWGDAIMAVIRSSGDLEEFDEGFSGSGDGLYAWCSMKRKGDKEAIKVSFSVADAKRAGLWGRNTWKQYPKRMLKLRARGFLARDLFGDHLGGMISREEAEDYPEDVSAKRVRDLPPARKADSNRTAESSSETVESSLPDPEVDIPPDNPEDISDLEEVVDAEFTDELEQALEEEAAETEPPPEPEPQEKKKAPRKTTKKEASKGDDDENTLKELRMTLVDHMEEIRSRGIDYPSLRLRDLGVEELTSHCARTAQLIADNTARKGRK